VVERTSCDFSKTVKHESSVEMVRYMWYRVTYSAIMLRQLSRLARSEDFAVIHWLDNPEMVTLLLFAWLSRLICPRLASAKWFLNVHPGDLSFGTGGQHPLRRLYKGLSGCALRLLLRRGHVQAVFVHGEWIRDTLVSRLGLEGLASRVIVAPYGAGDAGELESGMSRTEARRILGVPDKAFVVLSFGMIRRDKRLDDIVQAVSWISDATLVIAGAPVDVDDQTVRDWVHKANIAERVILRLEYIPEREIGVFFRAADVAVLAHDRSFAGQSGPLHLACSYQVPVVVSNVGDIGRFVREHGVGEVFPPGDWPALADLLNRFHGMSADTYRTYVAKERELAVAHSWDNMVECYLGTYVCSR
jgi:glycosyltransferase involved in cell wall biosynthesis